MALAPRIVDAVAPLPVAVAGGIADARGVCASIATTNPTRQGSLPPSGGVASLGGAFQSAPRTCAYSAVRPCRCARASRSSLWKLPFCMIATSRSCRCRIETSASGSPSTSSKSAR